MNIANVILDSVVEQDRVVALENCFHTWDGKIDADVMVGGIADRIKAMGDTVESITVNRKDLNKVEIVINNVYSIDLYRNISFSHSSITDFSLDGIKYSFGTAVYDSYFTEEEKELMAVWFINNFHH